MVSAVRDHDRLGFAGSAPFIGTVGWLIVAAGAALGIVRFVNGSPVERGFEGALGAASLGALIAAPGVLALLALRDRPVLLLPAGVALVPLAFLSLAGVTLPLLVPAAMLFVAYGRRSTDASDRPLVAFTTTVFVFAGLVLAGVVLFVRQDPRSYVTENGGGSTSDVITVVEALLSLTTAAATIAGGWLLARRNLRQ